MHRNSLLLAAAFATASISAQAQDGWINLFNGKDLSNWVNVNCAPETWRVEDGVIKCTGKPTGALRTQKMYENFQMEVEWRHVNPRGNAGIFIWSSPIAAKGVPFLRSIEVQVLDHGYGNTDNYTTHGDVFPIHGATMVPFNRNRGMRSFPSENRSKPSPEWNHYLIEGKDGVLRLSVNGKEVNRGDKCNWRKGYIGLESEGAPTEWRVVRIKELPGGNAPAEESAPEAQNHRPLYTGADLRGWKTTTPERWQASDWQLRLKAGEPGEPLWNETEFGDGEVILDVKAEKKSDREPAVLVRSKEGEPVKLSLAAVMPSGGPPAQPEIEPGKWNRVTLTFKGGNVTMAVNGKQIAEQAIPAGAKRSFGIADAGVELTFANFYFREL